MVELVKRRGRPKLESTIKSQMRKPKFKIGSIVNVNFLGKEYKCKLLTLCKNPQHEERWIYKGEVLGENFIIPYIGVKNTEKFANII